jgi:phenylacetate-CoA ligase
MHNLEKLHMRADVLALVLAKRRALRSHERWSRERIAARQQAQLVALLRHARRRSPYYRDLLAGRGDVALTDIPPLTKSILMTRFDEISTDDRVRLADVERFLAWPQPHDHEGQGRLFANHFWVAATSGSSGRRSIIPASLTEWTSTIASYARAQEWAGIQAKLTGHARMAVVSSTSKSHQSALVGATVQSPFLTTERFDAGAPLHETIAALNRFQPEILVAYASMLRILADEQRAGRLAIAPRCVNGSSEPLTGETRAHVRDAWRVECFDVYAATETSGIAAECSAHEGLHLFEDLVIVEVVDDAYRAVRPGDTGTRALVTVLSSRTLPLIRYELTDRVRTLSDEEATAPCACGRSFRRIAGVEGRSDDVLRMPRADAATESEDMVLVHPVVFHRVLEAAAVAGWQVRQHGGDLELLLARPASGVDAAAIAAAIAAGVKQTGARAPHVDVVIVDAVPAGAAGKRPRVVADRHADSHAQGGGSRAA